MQISTLISKILHKFHPVRVFNRAKNSYIEFHTHAEFKIQFVALIGVIGFPSYYVIWKFIFLQPYESLALRLIGFVLCVILLLSDYWPKVMRKYRILFSYITFLYCLSFFFTVMLLMNEANTVWLLSAMTALLFVVLLHDAINMFISTIVGASSGYLYYYFLTGTFEVPYQLVMSFPVFAFTFLGVFLLNYSDDVIAKAKHKAASSLASNIAHEMRTPLLGVQLEADKVDKYIPKILEGYSWAKDHGWNEGRLNKRQITAIGGSMKRVKEHTNSANLMIDMLLMNVKYQDIAGEEFSIHSARETILQAIDRYHFRPGEKELLFFDGEDDFEFWGAEVLLVHVLFNLMKNSFRAINAKGSGKIGIKLVRDTNSNSIIFRDTGKGIPSDVVNYVFIPFFSGAGSSGAGVGLSFSKNAISSMGGDISCHSVPGEGTEFIISLPKLHKAEFAEVAVS